MTQRQLYLSNEETIRAKDLEYRSLKTKITSAELHAREKDSKIDQLTAQLENMRMEASEMAEEKQKLSSIVKAAEHEVKAVEEEVEKLQDERQLLATQLADAKISHGRLIDYESELQRMKILLDDTRKVQNKEREQLEKHRSDGKVSKQVDVVAKEASGGNCTSLLEEKLSQLQYSYDMLLSRNYALVAEADRLRKELCESNHRFGQLNFKLSECERSLEDANQTKQKLVQQITTFQKMENEWEKLEREMRDELVILRKDRLVLTSDHEELKRKLVRAEVEKKEVDGLRARLDREVASLKKHVEALEEDKSRTEAAIRNSINERRAIDKSLAAMEKENAELYRNCAQLQSQIAHLERDSDPNSIAKVLKDQGQLEARIAKLVIEKEQLELVIERKDMKYTQKLRVMESQLAMLRNQLELEKKRKIDMQKVTRGDTDAQQHHFSRTSDLRMNRTKSIRRQVNPFRV
ncbi:hypothetical protein DICVIV_02587 [Dictyocaulus viviparus]|uniref:Uncharacterized protein n=1 Tax=Dictyocaulus viviparus TaxID=29172 RepID=A0A0D8Y4X5_DICVI|nr:hypothetical protein DICVIV_02587 [Dictyocaulus viviparus]